MVWHNVYIPLHQENIKTQVMNTTITLDCLSAMISSEDSYRTLVDMINEMDLELMDACMA